MRKKLTEEKRQFKRKEMEKTSRLLDNYYNPNIHKKTWEPSGKLKEKNKYVYGETGLAHNIADSAKIEKNHQKNKEQIHFLEFDYLEDNDVIIIIEHCANCENHIGHTNHSNDIFKYITKLLQICINIRYPYIKVYLKPIDTYNNKINRIGALEIQIGMKINNKTTIETLFSKLNSGQWPNIHNILNKINLYVPVFNFKFQVYDKEEGENTESTIIDSSINESKTGENKNNNNQDSKKNVFKTPSKYENIKINLYSFKSELIENNCKEAANAIDMLYNSKKKLELYNEAQTEMNNNNINNILNRTANNSFNNMNNNSLKSNFSFNTNISKKGEIIEDLSILNQLKGKFLCSGYTDKLGFLYFENVPFDSYIIEVEGTKKFMGCGFLIQFKKLFQNNDINKCYVFNKIIGLKRQTNAYVEVYLFSNEVRDNNNFEINFIEGAQVLLKKLEQDEFYEFEENIKGRYELSIEPCGGTIIVIQNGKEIASREVAFSNGLNKINIEI